LSILLCLVFEGLQIKLTKDRLAREVTKFVYDMYKSSQKNCNYTGS